MPPSAATSGTAARRRLRKSPITSSRLASRPTTRKKSAMSPSLTQWRRSSEMAQPPSRIESSVVQTDSYECGQGEFAQTSAASVAATSAAAPPVSVVRKSRSGAAAVRAHDVRSIKRPWLRPMTSASRKAVRPLVSPRGMAAGYSGDRLERHLGRQRGTRRARGGGGPHEGGGGNVRAVPPRDDGGGNGGLVSAQ